MTSLRSERGDRIASLAVLRGLLAALVLVVAGLVVAPGLAVARGSGYYVTFAARSCPTYSDVDANKARNDIQESLDDLGPDSPYNASGGLVDPAVEEAAPQDACSPLPNWTFTLGHGYQSLAVSGPWGDLSKVTDPFPRGPIVTQASTPLYDQYHNRVNGQSIAGATTIQLSDDERQQASVSGQLWAQGGVPSDPVLAQQFPGPEYGFAALRCAADAVNGDNVETIFFPAGVTHVFCYALYVVPPPTSGTITIQKRVVGAPAGENPAFHFSGPLSFDPERVHAGRRAVQGLLPRRRPGLAGHRGRGRQLPALLGQLHRPDVIGEPRDEHLDGQRRDHDGESGRRRARHLRLHQHLPAAGGRSGDRQDHPRRRRAASPIRSARRRAAQTVM